MMKKGIRQQRHKLKKKYFDPFPLHLVQTTSPISHMTDAQWDALVTSWKDQKKLVSSSHNTFYSMLHFHICSQQLYCVTIGHLSGEQS